VPDQRRPGLAERLLPFLDVGDAEPLHRQIVDRVWLEVVTGTLETGERLPTVRQLAVDLNVHPNTVQHAYEELELLGVVVTRPGEGKFVALSSPDRPALERRAQLERLCRDVLTQGRALGFTVDDLIDMLVEQRADARDASPKDGIP
jgi:GntR family transcriptional regulator